MLRRVPNVPRKASLPLLIPKDPAFKVRPRWKEFDTIAATVIGGLRSEFYHTTDFVGKITKFYLRDRDRDVDVDAYLGAEGGAPGALVGPRRTAYPNPHVTCKAFSVAALEMWHHSVRKSKLKGRELAVVNFKDVHSVILSC